MEFDAFEGAPRDVGSDQGCAWRDEIRRAVGVAGRVDWLRAARGDAALRRLERDVWRYFPHHAEWIDGMAGAAGVPRRAFYRALARSCSPEAAEQVVVAAREDGQLRVACGAPVGSRLRRVAPEGRFQSMELAAVEATTPWLGVNERGLVVGVSPRGSRATRFAAPTALFARDCLERFEQVEPALEWCLTRPAAPGGSLLFADARGNLAGIDARAETRRVLQPSDGRLSIGSVELDIAGVAKPGAGGDARALEAALEQALAPWVSTPRDVVIADPLGRRIRPAKSEMQAFPASEAKP